MDELDVAQRNMSCAYPLAEEAETEIGLLKENGRESAWSRRDVETLFAAFDRWLQDPRLLDPKDVSLLRVTILNELTWLISEPLIGDRAWEHIRGIARELGKEDSNGLRESWIIAAFETFAEPPEIPEFLDKLFSLAADEDTRWAVFGAYDNVPWRLRPHAQKYSNGKITDDDCDRWLIESDRQDDEVLMQRTNEANKLEMAAPRKPCDQFGS